MKQDKAEQAKQDIVLPMDQAAIQRCIPHRYPFLFLDRVIELEPGQTIVALKNVSAADPLLQGHFPGNPVFPGVIMIEAMAQASAILGYYSRPGEQNDVLLTEISEARFRQKIIPGDVLRITVKVEKLRSPFFWFYAEVHEGERLVAKAKLSALMK